MTRYTFILALALVLLLFTGGCDHSPSDDKEYTNIQEDDDDEFEEDGDQEGGANLNPGDGDDAGDQTDDDDATGFRFTPPVLLDPGSIEEYFGPDQLSTTLNFGDSASGELTESLHFAAYTFDALPGASVTAGLKTQGAFQGALALYGPRQENGLWGQARMVAQAQSEENSAVIPAFRLSEHGLYLILVASVRYGAEGAFTVNLGCRGLCREPFCPDVECMSYCPSGFLPDINGCESCQCRTCECSSDEDCPQGYRCDDCSCQPELPDGDSCFCDEDPGEPVCDENGIVYPNACWADCLGVENTSEAFCGDNGGISCYYDSDCPGEMICLDGRCQGATENCECPDDYDPVCGDDGQTYLNICELTCNHVALAYEGTCSYQASDCVPECMLVAGEYAWVDGCNSQVIRMNDEPCEECNAQCLNGGSDQEGWYDGCTYDLISYANCSNAITDGCNCDDVYDPVCGYLADQSGWVSFPNDCEMECEGGVFAYQGECVEDRLGCTSNQDCPSGMVCSEDCSLLADDDEDSDPSLYPDDPEACPRVCMEVDQPIACMSDDDCALGDLCENGECVPMDPKDLPCVVTGCFGELCSEESQASSCEAWSTEYLCLDLTRCARTESGECSWLITETYAVCVNGLADLSSPEQACSQDSDCETGHICLQHQCIESECVCPDEVEPVCSEEQEYDNLCLGLCDNASYRDIGSCE